MNTESDISWIVKGAEVVTFQVGRVERYDHIQRTTITRVSAKSFTVDNGDRYDLASQSRRGAGAYDASYQCVSVDSLKGRAVLADLDYQQSVRRARSAVSAWEGDRTRANRLAAIVALQAIDDLGRLSS